MPGFKSSIQAYANYKKLDLQRLDNNGNIPATTESKNLNFEHVFEMDNSESSNIWLSQTYEYILQDSNTQYPIVYTNGQGEAPIFIIFDFEIEYGSVDLIETAYEWESIDDTHVTPDLSKVLSLTTSNALYENDTTYKGIAELKSTVTTDINYIIKEDTGQYLSARVFNSYNPLGYTTPMWMTNINPQSDAYSHDFYDDKSYGYATKDIAAENDMIHMTYYDGQKEDSVLFFDPFHKRSEVNDIITDFSNISSLAPPFV